MAAQAARCERGKKKARFRIRSERHQKATRRRQNWPYWTARTDSTSDFTPRTEWRGSLPPGEAAGSHGGPASGRLRASSAAGGMEGTQPAALWAVMAPSGLSGRQWTPPLGSRGEIARRIRWCGRIGPQLASSGPTGPPVTPIAKIDVCFCYGGDRRPRAP